MKAYWQRLAQKTDALTLRERSIIFATAALLLIMLVNEVLLSPQLAKQKQLSRQLQQEQAQIATIQADIQQQVGAQESGPQNAAQARLEKLKLQSAQMNATLGEMQKKLVAPDKMAELLESILRRNGKLRLLSLKSLPVTDLNAPTTPAPALAGEPAKREISAENAAVTAIYKHGVEIVVQGSYVDMMSYLDALESMPWQLFWGKAQMTMEAYPKATLTLTLYTLSLDEKWLDL